MFDDTTGVATLSHNAYAPGFVENPRVSSEGAKPDLQNHREIAEGAKLLPRGQVKQGVGSGISGLVKEFIPSPQPPTPSPLPLLSARTGSADAWPVLKFERPYVL
jgi:hypothetical protein